MDNNKDNKSLETGASRKMTLRAMNTLAKLKTAKRQVFLVRPAKFACKASPVTLISF